MRRLFALLGAVLLVVGVSVVLPLAGAFWRYSITRGEIKDVFLDPVGPDQARVEVVFEFSIDEAGGRHTYCSRGDNQVDSRFQRIEDPVLPKEQAAARARSLLGDDPRLRQSRAVYYRKSDPAGSAFMVTEGRPTRRYEIGLALILAGMIAMVAARRPAPEPGA